MHQKEQLRDNVVSVMQSQQHLPVSPHNNCKLVLQQVITNQRSDSTLFLILRLEDRMCSAWGVVDIHHINNSNTLQLTVVAPTFLQTLKIFIFMVLRWFKLPLQA